MPKKGSKREDKLNAKIAALLGKTTEEVKEAATQVYTEQEKILEIQSAIHYYEWRKQLIQDRTNKETDAMFEARLRMWRYKICKSCELEFAYSYPYNSIAYCSLDCVKAGLEKIGLTFSYGRPLTQRWGFVAHPAIVPGNALEKIESVVREHYADENGYFEIDRPTRPTQDNSSHDFGILVLPGMENHQILPDSNP